MSRRKRDESGPEEKSDLEKKGLHGTKESDRLVSAVRERHKAKSDR